MTINEYSRRVYEYMRLEYPDAVEMLSSMDCPLLVNVALHNLVVDNHASGFAVQSAAHMAADYLAWAKNNEPSWNKGAK